MDFRWKTYFGIILVLTRPADTGLVIEVTITRRSFDFEKAPVTMALLHHTTKDAVIAIHDYRSMLMCGLDLSARVARIDTGRSRQHRDPRCRPATQLARRFGAYAAPRRLCCKEYRIECTDGITQSDLMTDARLTRIDRNQQAHITWAMSLGS